MNKTFAVYMIIIAHENSIKMVDDAFLLELLLIPFLLMFLRFLMLPTKTPKTQQWPTSIEKYSLFSSHCLVFISVHWKLKLVQSAKLWFCKCQKNVTK